MHTETRQRTLLWSGVTVDLWSLQPRHPQRMSAAVTFNRKHDAGAVIMPRKGGDFHVKYCGQQEHFERGLLQ